jgi:hypothetical protein
MSSSVADDASVSLKLPTQADMSTGPDLTMINKHLKFSNWNWFRLESFNMADLLPSE